MNKQNDSVRLQIELSRSRLEELDKLIADTGIGTRKELINNALTLLEWTIDERKSGRILASLDENKKTFKELFMPIFSRFKACEAK